MEKQTLQWLYQYGYTNTKEGINHRTKTKCKRYCNKLFLREIRMET